MDRRGAITGRQAPGAFRCLPCQSFVTGTPSGHCPRCGYVPPVALAIPPAIRSRSHPQLPGLLALLALCALLVALVR